jgi:hypothetical protein
MEGAAKEAVVPVRPPFVVVPVATRRYLPSVRPAAATEAPKANLVAVGRDDEFVAPGEVAVDPVPHGRFVLLSSRGTRDIAPRSDIPVTGPAKSVPTCERRDLDRFRDSGGKE